MKTQNPSVGTQAASPIENLPTNLELELLYSYDGTEGKTLTNFDCGDANLLLVYFAPYAPSLSTTQPAIIYRRDGLQLVSCASDYNFLTTFTFLPSGIFSQKSQTFEPSYGINNPTQNDKRMVIRRIYAIKGFKAQGASGSSETSCPYEIGDILQTKNATPPAERWPGTEWAAIETFLLGASAAHEMGETGGEEKHTLTVDEMPMHRHMIYMNDEGTGILNWGPNNATQQSGMASNWTAYMGNSKSHNNMPPYTAVYIWERTA